MTCRCCLAFAQHSACSTQHFLLLGALIVFLALTGCARTGPIAPAASTAPPEPAPLATGEVIRLVFGDESHAPAAATGTLAAASGPALTAEQVLAIAYRQNPTFEEYQARLAAARAEILQAVAYPNPSLEANAGVGIGRESPRPVRAEYGVELSQPIELPAKRRARRAAAEAAPGVVARERDAFRADLRGEVLKAYDTVLFHTQASAVARETLRIAREIETIVRRRVEAGEAAEVDRIRAEVEARQAARAVELQLRKLAAWRAVLNTLTGRALPADFALTGSLHRELRPADIAQAQQIAASQHPSLRRLGEMLERQRLVIEREQKAWYPDLVPSLGLAREIDSTSLGGGLGLELPLWYRNQGGIAAAQAEQRRLAAERERARQEILRDIEVGEQNYAGALEQLAALERGLRAAAAETLKVETFRYELGESSLLELLDARRTAQQTEGEYIQALYDANVARTDLERAIGIGGGKES